LHPSFYASCTLTNLFSRSTHYHSSDKKGDVCNLIGLQTRGQMGRKDQCKETVDCLRTEVI